jgi:hypothetical protein
MLTLQEGLSPLVSIYRSRSLKLSPALLNLIDARLLAHLVLRRPCLSVGVVGWAEPTLARIKRKQGHQGLFCHRLVYLIVT